MKKTFNFANKLIFLGLAPLLAHADLKSTSHTDLSCEVIEYTLLSPRTGGLTRHRVKENLVTGARFTDSGLLDVIPDGSRKEPGFKCVRLRDEPQTLASIKKAIDEISNLKKSVDSNTKEFKTRIETLSKQVTVLQGQQISYIALSLDSIEAKLANLASEPSLEEIRTEITELRKLIDLAKPSK